MGRLGDRFATLCSRGERALIPFVTAGDPDLATTEALIPALAAAGADAIEIGVPFSDPIADGPTIQRASQRSLAGGTSLRRILELVKRVRPHIEIPLVLMGYANPFYAMGPAGFADTALEAGVDGVIVPDLPPEEGEDLYGALEERGVDGVLLAAPTTTPERMAMLAERSRGFLYYVSLTGVTSARAELAEGIEEAVRSVKERSPVPVCVGFGISTPEQAGRVASWCDGVVVGSALVQRMEEAGSPEAAVEAAVAFVSALKAPLRGGGTRRG